MGASVWRVGRTAEDRLMWRTGWGQVSGEWHEQQKIGCCMEDPSRQQCQETDNQFSERV